MDYFKFSIEKLFNTEEKEEIGSVLTVIHIDGQPIDMTNESQKELIFKQLANYAQNQLYKNKDLKVFKPDNGELSIVAIINNALQTKKLTEAKIYLKQYE